MKVKDLIDRLSKLDPQLDLYVVHDDIDHGPKVFYVDGVDTHHVETSRSDDGLPQVKFVTPSEGSKMAFIDVVDQF